MTEYFQMTFEEEIEAERLIRLAGDTSLSLKGFSDHELGAMIRGLEAEGRRLNRAHEGWPSAAWKANSNLWKVIGAELKSRRSDFQLSPFLLTRIDF